MSGKPTWRSVLFALLALGAISVPVLGASATFLSVDNATQGNWKGIYGIDGEVIAQDSNLPPGYATFSTNGNPYTWTTNTDVRALLTSSSLTSRTASTFYADNTFDINVNLTDGAPHEVTLYAVDWENGGRAETISVLDAGTNAVLNTINLSSFTNGVYYSWTVQGNVIFRVTRTGSLSAVVSGVFFGGGTANTVSITSPTAGTVTGVLTLSANATAAPSVGVYSVQFRLDGANLLSPITTGVGSSYSTQWDSGTASSGSHTLTAVVTDNLQRTTTSAGVTISTVNSGPAQPTATYIKTDTTSIGNWKTNYGQDGYVIPNDPSSLAPSYATLNMTGSSGSLITPYAYTDGASDTADPRAMQWGGTAPATLGGSFGANPPRNPSVYYDQTSATIDLNLTDGQPHQVAIYALDFDVVPGGRSETITISNANTNATLDVRTVSGSSFHAGEYFVWTLKGHVKIVITNTNSSSNLVYSGLYFGGGTPPPVVSFTTPAQGAAVSGLVTVTAQATSSAGVASVQFQFDGVNLGSPITTGGPNYTIQWPANSAVSGSHAFSAIATDTLGQSSSSGITITVSNPPPLVGVTSPTAGSSVLGIIPVTASASSLTETVTSVQFQLDGANLGAAIAGTGPYAIQWDTNTAVNAAHTLTAVATDSLGQISISPGVSIAVSNGGPNVNITNPLPGSVTGTVTVTAHTVQTNGPVASVQFKLDGTNLGALQLGAGPDFSLPLDTTTVATGTHVLTAVASDTLGQRTTSSGVSVIVSNPAPTVSITTPAGGTVVGTITVTATAASQTGTVTSVQFKLDGTNIGAAITGTSPYSKQWASTTATNGAHTLTAVATDALGQTTTSAGVSVTVNNPPPTVSITLPLNGATISGTASLTANANSTIGMASVQFLVDGVNFGTPVTGSGPTFTKQWFTGPVANGPHTLTAIAFDTQNQQTTSTVVTVTVLNTPPTINITAPTGGNVAGPITVSANASSSTAQIASVQFKVDGVNIGSAVNGTGPFSTQWNSGTSLNGPHTLTAVATDTLGITTTSAGIAVTVANPPPTVSIVSPTGAFALVQTVTVTASASSAIGLASVQFQLDGANLGAVVSGSGPSFSTPWLTTTAANGTHTLTAIAKDTQGQTSTSAGVPVNVSNGPPPPPSAVFVKTDTVTKGNWKGVYGGDGYIIPADSNNVPAYATYVPTGLNSFTWAPSSTDPRTLLKSASATDRIASAFYTNTSYTLDINLNDGQVHQLALYLLDYEGNSRTETISILNANTNAVLNSQAMSSFNGGEYAIWSIQGHVLVQVTYTGGQSAVVSGIFFDTAVPPPPPPTVSIINPSAGQVSGIVTVTASASSAAGIGSVQFQLDGKNLGAPVTGVGTFSTQWDTTTVVNGPHTLTAIATDTLNQATTSAGLSVTTNNTVAAPTVSVTSPVTGTIFGTVAVTATAGSTVGLASVQFRLDGVNLGALQLGAGPTYTIHWNTLNASNGPHTLTAIAADSLNQQTTSNGVAVTVNNVAPAATFTKLDTTTKGTWKGVYGGDGEIIPNDSTSPPSYATVVGPAANTAYTWNITTTDPRGLQKSTSLTDRIESVFYTSTSYTIDMNFTDGQAHSLALYCLDLENSGRAETISILNANTNAVLNTQAISNFSGGVYAVWSVQGHILVTLTYQSGLNAGISGLFFSTPTPPPPPPSVNITQPTTTSGPPTIIGTVTVTANALAPAGMASVQFKLDGNNLGSAVNGSGPAFSMQWDSTTTSNGAHTLTAVAVDTLGQSTTSAGVALTTDNAFTAPAITITAPSAGAVSGTPTISATATAPAGMASVQFKLDGNNLGSAVNGTGPTFTLPWNTTTTTNGPHVLTAVATDTLSQSTPSQPVNVSVSNVSAAASFVKLDATTQGTWKGVYGQEGYIIPNDSNNIPSYAVISEPPASTAYTWIPSTSDVRALQKGSSLTDRIASTYYSSTSFTFDINLTDGLPHELDLYCLDLENSPPRTETISILNATTNAVLATEAMSSFSNGVYAIFSTQGHVLVRVTYTGGLNAVLSGLFFKTSAPPPPPPTVNITAPIAGNVSGTLTVTASASATAGMSSVQFKLDGNNLGSVVNGSGSSFSTQWNTTTATNGPHNLTAVATDSLGQTTTSAVVVVTAQNTVTPPTVSITAPNTGTVSATTTVTANATATAGMSSVQFKLDGNNLGAPVTGLGPIYNLQWDTTTASNGSHTLTAVATDAEATPQSTTSSGITVSVVNVSASASFVKLDSLTKGNWKGVYGQDGYIIPNDSNSLPSYATIIVPSATTGPTYTWVASTTDTRALLKSTSLTDRIASTYYSTASFTFDVNLKDALTHELDLYFLDLDTTTRAESISILNATTNAVLATKPMSNFNGGVYAVFNVQGHVLVQLTYTGGTNAVLSGLFLKTNTPPPPPPIVSITTPTTGATGLTGTIPATASASAGAGMASVQFQLDGNNLGSPVIGTGSSFTFQWNTATASNGSHTLTAVATDALGQTTTSVGVSVSTLNVITAPTVSITSPNTSSVSGTVAVTANATSTAGMASVQFKLDGNNLGAPVNGSGSNFTLQWDTTTASNGPHTLTAVATDTQPQSTTSAPVSVSVLNSGPAASFVKLDSTTKGNWKGVYGQDGYIIPNDSNSLPGYATIIVPSSTTGPTYTWVPSTTDVRALLKSASLTDRIASTYYTNGNPSFTFDVNLTDAQAHELDLYFLDLETTTRVESVSILNATTNAVLATQAMSNFNGGVYAVFNVQGHVLVQITYTSGLNAVLSGLFLKTNTPPPPPPIVNITTPTTGATGLSGTIPVTASASAGAGMASVQFQLDGNNLGSPVTGTGSSFTLQWNTAGASNGSHTLKAVATDAVGQTTTSAGVTVTTSNVVTAPSVSITSPNPGTVSGTVTVTANATATAGMASVQFKLDGNNLGAPVTGSGSTFTMQWISTTASNGPHTLTAVATDTQPQSTTSAPVAVQVSNTGPSASFVKLDIATKGNWKGVYGQDGYIIPNDSSSLPAYATIIVPSATTGPTYTWVASTTDARALLKGASLTDRIASTYYSNGSFTFDVNLTDAQTHELDLYLWDLENAGRAETISILNATTNAVLATQAMSNYSNGVYAVFNVQGHVLLQVTYTSGLNAVLSGLFLKTNTPPPPPPIVSITTPTTGATGLSGTIPVTASASAGAGMASVQFKLDGNNLGSAVTGTGPYTIQWNSATTSNGSHTLTAVAFDALGQSTTSVGVTVTTANVASPPVVSITGPTGSVSGIVAITANATATAGMSAVQFQVDGSVLGSAVTGTGPTFSIPWNTANSSNGTHTLTAIATDVQGNSTPSSSVSVTVSNVAGNSATFVKLDTTTQGSWKGVYGQDGEVIPNDSNTLPSYATLGLGGAAAWSWFPSTTDVRALLKNASATDRIASTYYSNNNSFTMDLNLIDSQLHQVALYLVDFDTTTRNEIVSILDANTNAVLNSQPISSFNGGVWAVWNIQGHVLIQITNNGGSPNIIVNGLFFRSFNGLLPPAVSITTPTGGTVGGPVTISANATSAQGVSSLQFQVDGSNLGSVVNNAGSLYTTYWASPLVSNGTHTITATATDSLGLSSTSQPVNVSVSNGPAPTPSAIFLGSDITTAGNWVGLYGSDGYMMADGGASPGPAPSLPTVINNPPFYASVNLDGALQWTWHDGYPAADTVGLFISPTSSVRIGAAYYQTYTYPQGGLPLLTDVTFADNQQHQLSLYFVDWHHNVRTQTVQILDPNTQAILDTETITNFDTGIYLKYNIQGHVQVKVTLVVTSTNLNNNSVADSVVMAAMFFDPAH
jgi:hypothetical protein